MTPEDSDREGRRQRVRLERLALAIGACGLTVGITVAVTLAGYLPYTAAAIYIGVVAGLCTLFFATIRSGLNRRFADPSLTVPQLVAAGLAVSYVAYEGGEARPAFIAMYLIA